MLLFGVQQCIIIDPCRSYEGKMMTKNAMAIVSWDSCNLLGLPGDERNDYSALLCRFIENIRRRVAEKTVTFDEEKSNVST